MLKIAIPRENFHEETRIPIIPSSIEKLKKAIKAIIEVESGIGLSINISDEEYQKAGANVVTNRAALLQSADLVLRLHPSPLEEVALLKAGCIHISMLNPFIEDKLIEKFVNHNITAISLELMPRSTIAQKMDVLSSQANLAGYAATILAAEKLNKVFPMMTTPAGTISPAKIFIVGVGVAGLQAIATAKRLGAVVEAYDTRPAVEEQVKSLGAKFLKIELGETGQTKDGYATALTPEQLKIQQQSMIKACKQADVVITTAQVFGKKAPLLISKEMIQEMRPGSLIIDMATESGGNVEGSVANQIVDINHVKIFAPKNLPAKLAANASQMYSANLCNFILHFWNKNEQTFALNLKDEILNKMAVSHNKTKRI